MMNKNVVSVMLFGKKTKRRVYFRITRKTYMAFKEFAEFFGVNREILYRRAYLFAINKETSLPGGNGEWIPRQEALRRYLDNIKKQCVAQFDWEAYY